MPRKSLGQEVEEEEEQEVVTRSAGRDRQGRGCTSFARGVLPRPRRSPTRVWDIGEEIQTILRGPSSQRGPGTQRQTGR